MNPWIIGLIVLLLAYLVSILVSLRARKNYAHLPSHPQWPFIGNAYKIFGDSHNLFLYYEELSKMAEMSNKPYVLWAGPLPVLILSNPDDIKAAANTFLEKPFYYNFAKIWLGNGVLLAPGWLWKKNVKKVASAFIGSAVEQYQGIFNEQAQKLVRNLEQETNGDFFDSFYYVSLSSLETICKVSFGASKTFNAEKYYAALHQTLDLILARITNVFLHPEWIYRLTSGFKKLSESVAVLHDFTLTILRKKKQDRNLGKSDIKETEKSKAFLDLMLDLSETDPHLTEKQILSETATVIVGGQETVANTLFYIFLVIGTRKDVQDKLCTEIKNVLGDRDVQKEDLHKLVYCEAVINETLRLYSPVVGVLRYADRDLKLSNCTVVKGTAVVLNFWGAGRSERLWGASAPDFDPDRWMPPNVPCTNAHLPFSTGKRACIGKKYAMAFLKTVVANCVRNYEFTTDEGFKQTSFKIDLALRPVDGNLIKIRRRN
ncbi:unnamed protein product [Leptosia nina]|uniref:Cytochrome P450 n=1 Tax=Leptosia nina TaxID=320188 RepID=A0AAV1JM09_9NEOP